MRRREIDSSLNRHQIEVENFIMQRKYPRSEPIALCRNADHIAFSDFYIVKAVITEGVCQGHTDHPVLA